MPATNRTAALNTVWATRTDDEHAAADARDLLDMLGLIGEERPCSRHLFAHPGVAEDAEARTPAPLSSINCDIGENRPASRRSANLYDPPPLKGRHCPPGLRVLFEGAAPVTEPKPKPAPPAPKPAKAVTPRKPRAAKPKPEPKPRKRAACGTEGGYRLHRREGTEICQPCRVARRVADRIRARARYQRQIAAGLRTPRKYATCPSPSGLKKHRREGTPICDGCREAYNAQRREADRQATLRRQQQRAQRAAA